MKKYTLSEKDINNLILHRINSSKVSLELFNELGELLFVNFIKVLNVYYHIGTDNNNIVQTGRRINWENLKGSTPIILFNPKSETMCYFDTKSEVSILKRVDFKVNGRSVTLICTDEPAIIYLDDMLTCTVNVTSLLNL